MMSKKLCSRSRARMVVVGPLLFAMLTGCGTGDGQPSLAASLASLSESLDGDTIHVRSPVSPADSFWGTRTPVGHDEQLRAQYPEAARGGFYATYHVDLGRERIGFLVRVPGPYATSAIDLFVLQGDSATALPPVRLADNYTTGAGQVVLESWLVDIDGDGVRDLVQRKRVFWTDELLEENRADTIFVAYGRVAPFTGIHAVTDTLLERTFRAKP